MPLSINKSLKFASAVLPAYARSRFRPVPIWAFLYVTSKCNLDCHYCFVKDNSKKNPSLEDLKSRIDKLHTLGTRAIALFGGEPTLRKDLPDIVYYLTKKGMVAHLSTNGILLKRKKIRSLSRAGLDVFNISVDAVSDTSSSQKTYDILKETFSILKQEQKNFGFDIWAAMVLTKKNAGSVIKTIKLLSDQGITSAVAPIIHNTLDDKEQDNEFFFITKKEKEQEKEIIKKLMDMKKNGSLILNSQDFFKTYLSYAKKPFDWYCAAGKYHLSINTDGHVQICAGLPAEKLHINDLDKEYFSKIKKSREHKFSKCKKQCFAACLYEPSRYLNNPLSLFKDYFLH